MKDTTLRSRIKKRITHSCCNNDSFYQVLFKDIGVKIDGSTRVVVMTRNERFAINWLFEIVKQCIKENE